MLCGCVRNLHPDFLLFRGYGCQQLGRSSDLVSYFRLASAAIAANKTKLHRHHYFDGWEGKGFYAFKLPSQVPDCNNIARFIDI